jgi:hypothetical protein
MRRALVAILASLSLVSFGGAAEATEKQWSLGASAGYGYLDDHYRWYAGGTGFAQARYGLTDAFDLDLELSAAAYPRGSLFVPGARAGVLYIVDVSRWIPQIGALVGVDDLWTLSCPATKQTDGTVGPPIHPCGHDVHPSVVIPGALEFRVTKHFALGAQFRYSFMFLGDVSKQITVGASAAFLTGG